MNTIFTTYSGKKSNYEKSNAILIVKFETSDRAKRLAQQILEAKGFEKRQQLSYYLINELSFNADIDRLDIKVTNTKQWHKRQGNRIAVKKYGVYYPRTKKISIQNLTAVRAKELAPKTFLDTLLHEWMHHYDIEKLKINSIHTKGFYERIRSLKEKLEI
jgi:hypothetical protein